MPRLVLIAEKQQADWLPTKKKYQLNNLSPKYLENERAKYDFFQNMEKSILKSQRKLTQVMDFKMLMILT